MQIPARALLWQPPCRRRGPCITCSPASRHAQMHVACAPAGTHWCCICCWGHWIWPRGHGSHTLGSSPAILQPSCCGENGAQEGKRIGSYYNGLCWAPQRATTTTRQRAAEAVGGPACSRCGSGGGCRPPSLLQETTRGSPYMLFFKLVWIHDK